MDREKLGSGAEVFQMFEKHMPPSRDITLIILKGHLLVEQVLADILDSELPHSKAIYDARISFSNRLAIVKSIYGTDNTFPYGVIENLNSLRNQLVHSLEPKDMQTKLDDFINKVKQSNVSMLSKYSQLEFSERLKLAIISLYAYICGIKKGRSDVKSEIILKFKK